MHDMAFSINHDISVVSVLDLQDVACDRVCRHRLNEIQASLLEGSSVRAAVFVDEIAIEIVDLGSAHFISRCGIGYHINHTTLRNAG